MRTSMQPQQGIGWILIAVGLLGLMGALGWLQGLGGVPMALLFAVLAYLAWQQARRSGLLMWALAVYPLAGLGVAALAPEPWGGFSFLASLGLAFVHVVSDRPSRWWPVIPAGALFSLALSALADGFGVAAGVGGSLFLLGLAITFLVLARWPYNRQPWGWYPAAALAVLALLSLTTAAGWVIPVVLVIAGVLLLWRTNLRA